MPKYRFLVAWVLGRRGRFHPPSMVRYFGFRSTPPFDCLSCTPFLRCYVPPLHNRFVNDLNRCKKMSSQKNKFRAA